MRLRALDVQNMAALMQRLTSATTMDELHALCREYSEALGFQHFVYALRVPTHFADARLIMVDGYPPGWVKHYFEQHHFDADPVMAYCAQHVVPTCWSDLTLEPGSQAERMMREAAGFGLRDGVTMPLHSPQGELGILSFAVDAPPEEARLTCQNALVQIQMVVGYLHEAVRRVNGLAGNGGPVLTSREIECLRWAADGKTSGEIAQLLGLSESTANFHLNNTMRKLDVVNRQQAVAKATLQGLIQPRPF